MIEEQKVNSLLDIIEKITQSKVTTNRLSDDNLKKLSPYLEILSDYLGSTHRQALLFAALYAINLERTEVDLDDISSKLNCSILTVFKYLDDFEELIKQKVIRKSNPDRRRRRASDRLEEMKYYIPIHIIKSVAKGDKKIPCRTASGLSKYEFLDFFSNLLDERGNEQLTQRDFDEAVNDLISDNKELEFLQTVSEFSLNIVDQYILFYTCSLFTDFETGNVVHFLRGYFSDSNIHLDVQRQFVSGESKLFKLNLLESVGEGLKTGYEIQLTEYSKDLLFGDDKELFVQTVSNNRDLIISSDLVPQRLFFNKQENEQIQVVSELLKPENYNDIRSRMSDRGLRTGINILLYGPPGGGKSQLCMNLAHYSNRNIFKIELEQTKSKWYGDSEKIMMEWFKRYRTLIKNSSVAPILFINECDGLLSKRVSVNSSLTQTMNTIQNILLEQLESLNDGIVLATTNLTANLDSAFARRFLYKIELKQADEESRRLIMMDKIPGFTEQEYDDLSRQFNLSGGQIENLSRKVILQETLSGESIGFESIRRFCEEELQLDSHNHLRNKIGF